MFFELKFIATKFSGVQMNLKMILVSTTFLDKINVVFQTHVHAFFGDRTSFRAKGLRFVLSRWHCPCSRLQKRNRKEGGGQEGKRARGEDVREDEKMRRCEKM